MIYTVFGVCSLHGIGMLQETAIKRFDFEYIDIIVIYIFEVFENLYIDLS